MHSVKQRVQGGAGQGMAWGQQGFVLLLYDKPGAGKKRREAAGGEPSAIESESHDATGSQARDAEAGQIYASHVYSHLGPEFQQAPKQCHLILGNDLLDGHQQRRKCTMEAADFCVPAIQQRSRVIE